MCVCILTSSAMMLVLQGLDFIKDRRRARNTSHDPRLEKEGWRDSMPLPHNSPPHPPPSGDPFIKCFTYKLLAHDDGRGSDDGEGDSGGASKHTPPREWSLVTQVLFAVLLQITFITRFGYRRRLNWLFQNIFFLGTLLGMPIHIRWSI